MWLNDSTFAHKVFGCRKEFRFMSMKIKVTIPLESKLLRAIFIIQSIIWRFLFMLYFDSSFFVCLCLSINF